MNVQVISLSAAVALISGCTPAPTGVALLGGGTHETTSLHFETIADADNGLATPRDLAINPLDDDQLWIISRETESMTVMTDFRDSDDSEHFDDNWAGPHFMAQPAGLAFGENGMFATIHETDARTQGPTGTPRDFMGPSLWPSDLNIFDGGESHTDMLHNSPNGMGIAWAGEGNAYWVFDGYHSSITRYDFQSDHGPGGTDHSDGQVYRFVEGEVDRVEDVPSHMWFDAERDLLYINDTGNARIAVLDARSGEEGSAIAPNYDTGFGTQGFQRDWLDADLDTFVDADDVIDLIDLEKPCGMAVYDDPELGELLLISDNGEDTILAFDFEGNLVDWVEVEVDHRGLMGIEIDGDTLLYTDADANEVRRMSILDD